MGPGSTPVNFEPSLSQSVTGFKDVMFLRSCSVEDSRSTLICSETSRTVLGDIWGFHVMSGMELVIVSILYLALLETSYLLAYAGFSPLF